MSVKLESLSSPFVSIWSLQIDSVSIKDEGWYDCQVNTEPKVSHQSYLHIEPKSPGPRRGVLHSKELSDAPSNPQVIPEIQHFLKSMKKQNNEARLKLQIREGAGSQKLQPLRDGDPLVLECVILPSSASLIKLDQMSTDLYWIREGSGEALSIDVRSRRRQVPQKGKAILIFSSVIQSDEGSYTCLSQEPKVDSATIQINLSGKLGQTERGPLALAQIEERDGGGGDANLQSSFESEVDSRLTSIEARLSELELELNHLLQLQEGR